MDKAKMKFKLKTKMMKNVKLNFKNDPKSAKSLWKCPECEHIDSQQHILWCNRYESLKTTSYFQKRAISDSRQFMVTQMY